MKVAVAVRELNIRGGTHKQVLRLAEHLARAGDEVTVYTKHHDPARCFPGMERLAIRSGSHLRDEPRGALTSRWVNLVASFRLARDIVRRCDVLNLHDNGLEVLWLLVKLLRPGLPCVWQVNDVPPWFGVGAASAARPGLLKRGLNVFRRALSRLMALRVDLVTVNVRKNAERVRECMGRPAEVFHCGVDLRNAVQPSPSPAPGGELRLVSTGVFLEYRNYETIVQAQRLLRDRYGIATRLVILGSTKLAPDYAEKVGALAAKLGVACEILGEVDEPTLLARYASSDVFLFLNVDQSWGLAVFEAMDCGLPVVVSRSVGAVELLHPGVDAEVVDPKDVQAVAEVLRVLHAEPERRRRLASAGFQATRGMTWDRLYGEPVRAELARLAGRAPVT